MTFNYGGGYFSFEVGDIDPGLSFGHGFLEPGSGAGARFDLWLALDGTNNIDGFGISGGGGAATTEPNLGVPGGNDVFRGTRTIFEDGVDQYQGGTGLDLDSFAFDIPNNGHVTNLIGAGADGTICAYGRVFESDPPQVGDWYYVGPGEVLRDVSVAVRLRTW